MYVEIKANWDNELISFEPSKKDIYFSESYLRLTAKKNETALCIICKDDTKIMLMPFLRGEYQDYFDFETPYGYGGFISNSSDSDWNNRALDEILSYFATNNYIAGFIRFHPLLNNADLCRKHFQVIDDRKTILINTSITPEEIWTKQISSKNRNMIRKAEKNGLEFVRDDDFVYINEFQRLYNSTMEYLNAENFYFFSKEYYQEFIKIYKGKGFLGCIKKDENIIGAALFMYENEFGHYHLAGSNKEFSSLGVNNLLIWKVACEFHKEGVKEFHLGGGTNSSDDNSLFRFKHSFSDIIRQFSIGKIIFNTNIYNIICENWKTNNPEKNEKFKHLLLKYRY